MFFFAEIIIEKKNSSSRHATSLRLDSSRSFIPAERIKQKMAYLALAVLSLLVSGGYRGKGEGEAEFHYGILSAARQTADVSDQTVYAWLAEPRQKDENVSSLLRFF